MPIAPQNLVAAKEQNNRVFIARVAYIVVYLILTGLFIAYAVTNLLDFLDNQDNPVVTSNIEVQDQLEYPVVLFCPFFTQKPPLRSEDVSINSCGSVKFGFTPSCIIDETPDKAVEDYSRCVNNKQQIDFSSFRYNRLLLQTNSYGCILLNSDKPLTKSRRMKIATTEICGINKEAIKRDIKNHNDTDPFRAYAIGTGAGDVYDFTINTPVMDKTDKEKVYRTFSVLLKNTIDDFTANDGDFSVQGVPEGSWIQLRMRRVSFECLDCDEPTYYYNYTTSLLDTEQMWEDKGSKKRGYSTRVTLVFESITTEVNEEVVSQTTLDYLGNFAGMLGTLLGFAVINWLDRILAFLIINHGGIASVWDSIE